MVYRQPRAIRYPPLDRNYLAFAPKGIAGSIYNTALSGFSGFSSLSAQPTPLGGSLGRSNERGSKTSQACYGHPRCNLNLVRLFRFSTPQLVLERLFLFPHPRGHKPTAPFAYCAVPNPRVKLIVNLRIDSRIMGVGVIVVGEDNIEGARF